MNPGTAVTSAAGSTPPPVPARRADAGAVRLGDRDIAGLLLCGDMYGAPYDLLAGFLGVRADRARGIVARWRHAGYADTGPPRPRAGVVLADPHRPNLPCQVNVLKF
jgi:hypothetical protein